MTIGSSIYLKGKDLISLYTEKNYNRGYLSLLKRFGAKTQNGVYSTTNYLSISAWEIILCLSIQTGFRTGNSIDTYQNGYNSTQEYGIGVPNMHMV